MAWVNWLETAFLSICVVTKKGRHCVQLQISGICIQFNFWDRVCMFNQKKKEVMNLQTGWIWP